jgi:hypothetical protein
LLGVTLVEYTPHQMSYDLRRLRLKGLIYRPPKANRYLVTPYGWKVARLFSRLERLCFAPRWPSSSPPTPFCPSRRAKYMCRRYCCIPFAPHNWPPDFEYGRIEKYSGRHEGECA